MVSEAPFDTPADRSYDRDHHLWAQRDQASANVRVGIDAMGLESLGELAYVEMREVGTRVVRGESMGTLEAAKMTSNIAAPVSGTIVACNEAVLRDPLLVNRDAYAAGWLLEIQPTNWDEESGALLSGDDIAPWAQAESARIRADQRGT